MYIISFYSDLLVPVQQFGKKSLSLGGTGTHE